MTWLLITMFLEDFGGSMRSLHPDVTQMVKDGKKIVQQNRPGCHSWPSTFSLTTEPWNLVWVTTQLRCHLVPPPAFSLMTEGWNLVLVPTTGWNKLTWSWYSFTAEAWMFCLPVNDGGVGMFHFITATFLINWWGETTWLEQCFLQILGSLGVLWLLIAVSPVGIVFPKAPIDSWRVRILS